MNRNEPGLPRCLRRHVLTETGFYRDPVTGKPTCIACQEPMDLSLRKKGPRPGVVEPMTRSQRYYWRNREQRIRDAVEFKQRRRRNHSGPAVSG